MEPIRSCDICKNKVPKSKLLRIVSKNHQAILDENQKMNTRGIYFCNNKKCLEKAQKMLDRNKLTVKINVDKESLKKVLEEVESELGE
ncbi:MAG: YlxR family protein [Clostridia bacterium]|nr:YlxR family protein [Clostridia bacterium]